MEQKYFQRLPEQEYVFKNYFQTGSKEGCNCADCGTYIVNVVQLFGTTDRQTYNVGTTCCNKISKDREVFLTPKSVQRKKIFMTEYKKITTSIKNLEKSAELFGGITGKFIDFDYSSYDNSLTVNIFILTKEGVLINEYIDYTQRCFSALKDIFNGWDITVESVKEFLNTDWNQCSAGEIKKILNEDYKKRAKGEWNYQGSALSEFLDSYYIFDWNKFDNEGIAQKYPEQYEQINSIKGFYPRFW